MKPVPATSDKGGVISKEMDVKGPERSTTSNPRKVEGGKVGGGEQGGLGKQRKGYGEQSGVECRKKEGMGNGLPKPGGGNKGKDSNVGREVTGKPAGW